MYTVQMEHECGCFKKSEYASHKTFERQQDAYQYANIVIEFMSEEFCQSHLFFAEKTNESDFLIRVVDNPNAGSCSSGGCGTGLDASGSNNDGSCGCS